VLPVVVSAIGGLVGFQLGRGQHAATISVGVFVIALCVALYIGAIYTTDARATAAAEAVQKELELRTEYRLLQLRQCSEIEYSINRERRAIGLPPVTIDFVCAGR